MKVLEFISQFTKNTRFTFDVCNKEPTEKYEDDIYTTLAVPRDIAEKTIYVAKVTDNGLINVTIRPF